MRCEVVARASDIFVPGVACPHPARNCLPTQLAGLLKRIALDRSAVLFAETGVRTELLDEERRARYRCFVRRVCRHFFPALPYDFDVVFSHWIQETGYTHAEQLRFTEIAASLLPLHLYTERDSQLESRGVFFKGKCFIKAEFYDSGEWKHARWICPVDERARVHEGPFVHAVEKAVYSIPCAIKFVSGSKRAAHVAKQLDETMVHDESDWSSMEAHHTIAEVFDGPMLVYHSLMRAVADAGPWLRFVVRDTLDGGSLSNANLTVDGLHVLFSGKNRTSIQNFLVNFLRYWWQRLDQWGEDVTALFDRVTSVWTSVVEEPVLRPITGNFEGDDSANSRDWRKPLARRGYARDGHIVKMKTSNDIEDVDFISLSLVRGETIAVTEIQSAVARLGWVLGQYLHAREVRVQELMLAKGYSMLYTYRGCPVLEPLARYVIRCYSHRCLERFFRLRRGLNRWHFEQYHAAWLARDEMKRWPVRISDAARDAVAKLSNIPVHEQLRVEKELNHRKRPGPLDMFPEWWFPDAWLNNFLDNAKRADRPEAAHKSSVWTHQPFTDGWVARNGAHLEDPRGNAGRGALGF